MEQRVRFDLDYIRRWSPLFDIRIIFETLIVIVRDRNAYWVPLGPARQARRRACPPAGMKILSYLCHFDEVYSAHRA